VRDTYAAVSNPFSISWWFTSRRQEVLTKLQSTRKVDGAYTNTMSRTMGSAPAGDGTRRWVGVGEEDLEAGLGPGVQMREKKKTVEPLLSKMAKEGPFAQKVGPAEWHGHIYTGQVSLRLTSSALVIFQQS
jgi:hypothetical protein